VSTGTGEHPSWSVVEGWLPANMSYGGGEKLALGGVARPLQTRATMAAAGRLIDAGPDPPWNPVDERERAGCTRHQPGARAAAVSYSSGSTPRKRKKFLMGVRLV